MGVNRPTGSARAWYPSGPRLDGSSSSKNYYTPPAPDVNPDPKNFTLLKSERVGEVFVSMIQYPNCTNFEGKKVLVTDFNPKLRTEIDPHFMPNGGIIARFAPTDLGWKHAKDFARTL